VDLPRGRLEHPLAGPYTADHGYDRPHYGTNAESGALESAFVVLAACARNLRCPASCTVTAVLNRTIRTPKTRGWRAGMQHKAASGSSVLAHDRRSLGTLADACGEGDLAALSGAEPCCLEQGADRRGVAGAGLAVAGRGLEPEPAEQVPQRGVGHVAVGIVQGGQVGADTFPGSLLLAQGHRDAAGRDAAGRFEDGQYLRWHGTATQLPGGSGGHSAGRVVEQPAGHVVCGAVMAGATQGRRSGLPGSSPPGTGPLPRAATGRRPDPGRTTRQPPGTGGLRVSGAAR
jgi:hypothetical protein